MDREVEIVEYSVAVHCELECLNREVSKAHPLA